MNIGHWTALHEDWFVKRREQFRQALLQRDASKLELKTAGEWRNALKNEQLKQRKFVSAMDRLSAQVLS